MKPKVALYIRGHIRNAFRSNRLLHLLNRIDTFCDFDLYFQSWTTSNSNNIWNVRRRRILNENVSEKSFDYFKNNFFNKIKGILIINESNVTLHGNLTGNVSRSLCKLQSWKNMWYGIYKGMEMIPKNRYDYIINTRYDICEDYLLSLCRKRNVRFGLETKDYRDFLNYLKFSMFNKKLYTSESDNIFTFYPKVGCDNFIMSNETIQRNIVSYFNFSLDTFLDKLKFENKQTGHQEMVFRYYLDKLNLRLIDFRIK